MGKNIFTNRSIPPKTIIFITFLTVVFGSSSSISKLILINVDPTIAAELRFIIASVSIIFWAFVKQHKFYVEPEKIPPLIIISLGFTLQIFLSYLGINYTYASRFIIITNSVPFFVMILSHYFIPDEEINIIKVLGCCIAFTGVILIFSGNVKLGSSFFWGDIFTLVSVVIWAIVSVYTKKVIANYAPFHIVLYPMLFLSIISIFIGIINGKMIPQINPAILGAIIYQGIIVTAFGFVAWNTLLKKYGATSLHSFIFLTPISGIFSSIIILDEKITLSILLALVFIAAGLFLINKTV